MEKTKNIHTFINQQNLTDFSEDVGSLWTTPTGQIPILDHPPDPLTFLREYVSMSRPCIIRNAIPAPPVSSSSSSLLKERLNSRNESWRNNKKSMRLTLDDLITLCTSLEEEEYKTNKTTSPLQQQQEVLDEDKQEKILLHDMMLTVDVTPDGHGDCIRTVNIPPNGNNNDDDNEGEKEQQSKKNKKEGPNHHHKRMFVRPEERQMTLLEFRDAMRKTSTSSSCSTTQRKEEEEDNGGECLKNNHTSLTPRTTNNNNIVDDSIFNGFEDSEHVAFDENGLEIYQISNDNEEDTINDSSRSQETEKQTQKGQDDENAVYYYSRQNDCLRTELKSIFDLNLFPKSFPFAEQAFGTGQPDAINLWIGNENAVSSMHKDHYENLFYVLSGEKVFTVCPPADCVFLKEDEFESASFCRHTTNQGTSAASAADVVGDLDDIGRRWVVQPDLQESLVEKDHGDESEPSHQTPMYARWIEPDIEHILDHEDNNGLSQQRSKYLEKYPLLQHAHPIRIHVKEGDMLYLPSLWFHRVSQTCETVAINYWYDMKFDSPSWCYFNFLQHLNVATSSPT